MTRAIRLWPLAALAALAACGGKQETGTAATAAAPEEKTVNVLNWSDYVADTTVSDFQKATGIQVTYDVFDSNEVLETKLLSGRSGYDVVVPTAPFLERQIKAGVFLPLDKTEIIDDSPTQWIPCCLHPRYCRYRTALPRAMPPSPSCIRPC